jgi:hypothetical protein
MAFTEERVAGRIIAPPMPWTKRAAMRDWGDQAWAAQRLESTNTATPTRKKRRRPQRSPARPTLMSRAAKTRA